MSSFTLGPLSSGILLQIEWVTTWIYYTLLHTIDKSQGGDPCFGSYDS